MTDPIAYLGCPSDESGYQGSPSRRLVRAEPAGCAEYHDPRVFVPYVYGCAKPWAVARLAQVEIAFLEDEVLPVAPKPKHRYKPRRTPNRMHSQPALPPPPYAPATRSWKLESRMKREARRSKQRYQSDPRLTGEDVDRLLAEI